VGGRPHRDARPATTLARRGSWWRQQLVCASIAEDLRAFDLTTEADIVMSRKMPQRMPADSSCSDYCKGPLPEKTSLRGDCCRTGEWHPVIADPKGLDFARYGDVDC